MSTSKPVVLNKAVAIITNNTCNLTCSQCGTLQCYNFNDSYSWVNNEKYYRKWAEIADFPQIDLLGGEPFLNQDLYNWAKNIKNLWPDSVVTVGTNGTLLHLSKNIDLTRKLFDLDVSLIISTHAKDEYSRHEEYLWKIVEPFKNEIEIVDLGSDSKTRIEINKLWTRNGKTIVRHALVDKMFPNYVKKLENNTLILDDGDPVLSHENCMYNTNCYTIQTGLFYKCPLVFNYAIMKYKINYEDRAYPILESYKACSPFDDITEIEKFFSDLPKPITACSLCAFDKKKNPTEAWVPVTYDKTMKKAFKGSTKYDAS